MLLLPAASYPQAHANHFPANAFGSEMNKYDLAMESGSKNIPIINPSKGEQGTCSW